MGANPETSAADCRPGDRQAFIEPRPKIRNLCFVRICSLGSETRIVMTFSA